jgi:hypothetical protein
MTNDGWLTGWKQIADYHSVHIETVRRWYYTYKYPALRTPGGQPTILKRVADRWLMEYNRRKVKKLRSNLPIGMRTKQTNKQRTNN